MATIKSLEEKAARYDEAIEIANKYKDTHIMFPQIKDEIFPELKESEDERVRKDIKRAISVALDYSYFDIETANNCLAWLERQGEPKYLDCSTCEPWSDEQTRRCLINFLKSLGATEIPQASRNRYLLWLDNLTPKVLFKKGDFVVIQETTYQITKVENLNVTLSLNGRECLFDIDVLKNARLWTIQNAREGEVLAFSYASQNYILIYKRLYKKGLETKMSVFCFYCVEKDTYYDGTDSFHVMNHKEVITPATKEQCNQLEKAITEAGYKWDAEKKELKKVVAPKFNVHDCIIKKNNSNINDFGSFVITDITGGKYWYNDRIICDISEQDEWELYEPVR